MTCRDVRDNAEAFVAGELNESATQALLRHLETCVECRQEVETLRTLRTSVRGAFDRAHELQAQPEFLARLDRTLRSQVRPATGAVTQSQSQAPVEIAGAVDTRTPPPVSARYAWLAVAAALLLAMSIGLFWARAARHDDEALALDAAGDHRNCAIAFALDEKPIPLGEAARRYDPAFDVLETLPPDQISTPAGAAQVVARHSCLYHGRRFAHVVMKYRGSLVSLLVAASDDERADRTLRAVDSLSVISWHVPRHAILVVSDLPAPDLRALATAAAEPLSSRLAGAMALNILPSVRIAADIRRHGPGPIRVGLCHFATPSLCAAQ